MKKYFTLLYWLSLLLIIILGFVFVWITTTEAGGHLAVGKLLEKSSGNIVVEKYSGTLLHGINAERVYFKSENLELEIKNLHSKYSLFSLLNRKNKRLVFTSLRADTLRLTILPRDKNKPKKIDLLPVISTPTPVNIKSLSLGTLTVSVKDKFHVIENIESGAMISSDLLQLEAFSARYKNNDINADGTIQFKAPFPISINGTISTPKLTEAVSIYITGPIEDYRLSADTILEQKKLPQINANLSGNGTLKGIDVKHLNLKTLNGEIIAKGDLTWSGGFKANLEFKGKNINPGVYNEKFPGELSIEGNTNISDKKFEIQATSNGVIRDFPVNIKINTSTIDGATNLKSSQIRISSNTLDLTGNIYPGLIGVLDFNVDAPDISALHPDVDGQLKGRGKINGLLTKPVFDIDITGEKVAFKNHLIENLSAHIIPGTFRDHYSLNVTAKNTQSGSVKLKTTKIEGSLSPEKQNANIEILDAQLNSQIKTNIKGGFREDQWEGTITGFEIIKKDLPTYQLSKPANIIISKTNQMLTDFCLKEKNLKQDREQLCINGNFDSKRTSTATLELTKFPLTRLKPWIPDAGELSEKISLKATINGSNGIWNADLNGGFDAKNRIQSKLEISQNNDNILGNIDLQFNKLEWTGLFTEKILSPRGNLIANLNLSGKKQQPDILGTISLRNGFAKIPDLGTEITNISMTAKLDNHHAADVTGSLKSGDGEMTVKGKIDWLDKSGWKADFRIGGDNFEAVNLPEVRGDIMPNLFISASGKEVDVRGILTIPKAEVSLGNIQTTAVTPSSDEIIIGREKAYQNQIVPFDVNVRIELGENVHISGFGLNSHLDGHISIFQTVGKAVEGDGSIKLRGGRYEAFGQKLDIERGELYFNGPLRAPRLNVRASRKIEADNVKAGLEVTGTFQEPESRVFSIPALPETDALAYLLTGKPLGGIGEGDSNMLINAAARLGLRSSAGTIEKIRQKAGLDKFTIQPGQDISESALIVGKYLTPELYIQYATKLFSESEIFSLTYRLSSKLHLEAESADDNQSMDLIYQLER